MTDKIRVLIAEDIFHEREGFKTALSLHADKITVVDEAASAQEAFQKATTLPLDVVVMDLAWYGDKKVGIAAIGLIKANAPHIKFLVVTSHTELIDDARLAGAQVAVTKASISDAAYLVARIKDAYDSPDNFPTPSPPLIEALTARQLEMLQEFATDKPYKEIAHKYGIAESTVKKHAEDVYGKLGVSTRAAAVSIAHERGLLGRRPAEP